MPRTRRGRTLRSRRSNPPSPPDVRYYRLLGSHDYSRNVKRILGNKVNELKKRGDLELGTAVIVKDKVAERKTVMVGKGVEEVNHYFDQLKRDVKKAKEKHDEDPFTQHERMGIQNLLRRNVLPG